MIHNASIPIGSKSLEIEIGKLAKQADGAAVVRFGDTVVRATAVFAKEPKENATSFPLTVDYRENTYAAGRIPGGWFKREGRPTEKEILTSRRSTVLSAPFFQRLQPRDADIALVLSADGQKDAGHARFERASIVLTCSLVPFYSPIGAIRVGAPERSVRTDPDEAEQEKSEIDLIVAGNDDAVVMVEAGAREVSEQKMLDAILFGHEAIRRIVAAQKNLQQQAALLETRVASPPGLFSGIFAQVRRQWEAPMRAALPSGQIRAYNEVKAVKKAAISMVPEERGRAAQAGRRRPRQDPDPRDDPARASGWTAAIRPGPTDLLRGGGLPRTHGSALFTRGETQALVRRRSAPRTTLRSSRNRGRERAPFLLHYNFPPLGWRGEVHARSLAARHRPRQPGATRPVDGSAERRVLPLHGAGRVRHPRVERLLVHGDGLRRDSRAHGRRRSHQVADRGHGDGPRRRGKPVCDPDGHRRPGGPLRRHGLQGRGIDEGITALQMDIKIRAFPADPGAGARTGAEGPAAHPRKDGGGPGRPRPNISPYAPRIFTMQIPRIDQ